MLFLPSSCISFILLSLVQLSSGQLYPRDENEDGKYFLELHPNFSTNAFHYSYARDGTLQIKTLTGDYFAINEDHGDRTFSQQYFQIGYPADSLGEGIIKVVMEIPAMNFHKCFNTPPFQIACLCYEDDKSDDDRYVGYGISYFYCGKKQSLVCLELKRQSPSTHLVSGLPSVIKNETEFKTKGGQWQELPRVHFNKDLTMEYTFKPDTDKNIQVDFTNGEKTTLYLDNPQMKAVKGYVGDKEYKFIKVLPFQIFTPSCQILWKFPNGKLINSFTTFPEKDAKDFHGDGAKGKEAS